MKRIYKYSETLIIPKLELIFPKGKIFIETSEFFFHNVDQKIHTSDLINVMRLNQHFIYFQSEDPPLNSLGEQIDFPETSEFNDRVNIQQSCPKAKIFLNVDPEQLKQSIYQCTESFIE